MRDFHVTGRPMDTREASGFCGFSYFDDRIGCNLAVGRL